MAQCGGTEDVKNIETATLEFLPTSLQPNLIRRILQGLVDLSGHTDRAAPHHTIT